MKTVLAADIGGTNIRAAIVGDDGTTIAEKSSHFELGDRSLTEDKLISRLTPLFSAIIAETPSVSAVGIGFPGFFTGDSGILIASPNLPNLTHVNLSGRLSAELKLPVLVQNDALCAAIGEQRFGAGKEHANLFHITLGTGIGGGLILNGEPYSGEGGMAMEVGHLCVERSNSATSCGCGNIGCLETVASASAVAKRYRETTGTRASAEEIYGYASNGDSDAKRVIEEAGSYLGIAIAEAIKLLDIRTVTISGGLTGAWELLYPPLAETLNDNLIPPQRGKVEVLKSTLEDNAGILGAATLVL